MFCCPAVISSWVSLTPAAISAGKRVRVFQFDDVTQLAIVFAVAQLILSGTQTSARMNDKRPTSRFATRMDGRGTSQPHYVFVYGTLKAGEPNCGVLTDAKNGTCTFLGKGTTVKNWPLVIASSFNIPYLLHCEGRGYVSLPTPSIIPNRLFRKFCAACRKAQGHAKGRRAHQTKAGLPLATTRVERGEASVSNKVARQKYTSEEKLDSFDISAYSCENSQSWSVTVLERDRASYWR